MSDTVMDSVMEELMSTLANELNNHAWEFRGKWVSSAVPSGGRLIIRFTDGTVVTVGELSRRKSKKG